MSSLNSISSRKLLIIITISTVLRNDQQLHPYYLLMKMKLQRNTKHHLIKMKICQKSIKSQTKFQKTLKKLIRKKPFHMKNLKTISISYSKLMIFR